MTQNNYEGKTIFRPQPGPQTDFLSTPADVALFGGGAGGGKTFGALLEGARGINHKDYRCSIFRRTTPQLTAPGGLWDYSNQIYLQIGSQPNSQLLKHTFRSGASIKFGHLQHADDIYDHQGDQITTLIFDELTHFLQQQFWYMFSRVRSAAGLPCKIRATCNPDAESWVKELVQWYLLPTGTPDPRKYNVMRYFLRINEQLYWASTPEELVKDHDCNLIDVKSFVFIPSTIEDNQILLQNDPGYIANLKALSPVECARLLEGNWNIKFEGKIFRQNEFRIFTILPEFKYRVIFIDCAAKTKEHNDYSVLQCWGMAEKGIYLVDQLRGKWQSPELKINAQAFINRYNDVAQVFIEDASAGTMLIQELQRDIKKPITPIIRTKDKVTRAYLTQGYISSGWVWVNPLKDYYLDFIGEATSFSADMSHAHDDQVDCMMDAIEFMLINPLIPANDSRDDTRLSRRIA